MSEVYICGRCEAINLHWGDCYKCGYDDLTPKTEVIAMYNRSKTLLEKIQKFEYADQMRKGGLTREIQEAEKRNWE